MTTSLDTTTTLGPGPAEPVHVAVTGAAAGIGAQVADRVLSATALVFGLTLVTADERLAAAQWLPTRSA